MLRFPHFLTRYDGYSPLHGQASARKFNFVALAFALLSVALVVTSVVLNVVFAVKLTRNTSRPLDDYQNLNTSPFWVDNSFALVSSEENAIVTTLYTDSYAPAVAALGHSLQKANSTARKIVLYFPSKISPSSLCLATASGFEPHAVERISPPHDGQKINPHFIDQFTKLSLWSLDTIGVRALVYLDADTLVVRNFDELFGLPYRFAAVPDVWGDWRGFTLEFNAGVLFVRPDSAVFARMVAALPAARFPLQFAEQAYLNQYFAADAVRLPLVYNGNLAAKTRFPQLWAGMRETMRVIHYTMVKPFVGAYPDYALVPIDELPLRVEAAAKEYHGNYKEEVELWGSVWEETRTTYARQLDHCLTLPTQSAGSHPSL